MSVVQDVEKGEGLVFSDSPLILGVDKVPSLLYFCIGYVQGCVKILKSINLQISPKLVNPKSQNELQTYMIAARGHPHWRCISCRTCPYLKATCTNQTHPSAPACHLLTPGLSQFAVDWSSAHWKHPQDVPWFPVPNSLVTEWAPLCIPMNNPG